MPDVTPSARSKSVGGGAALTLYRAAWTMLVPLAGVILNRRAACGKEDKARLGERYGRASRSRPDGELVWIHAASVGESLAALDRKSTRLNSSHRT